MSKHSLPRNWKKMQRRFFAESPEIVAPKLLGKLLARRVINGSGGSGWLAGRIVEVEAYLGPHITATPDPAAHSFRGVTDRNRVMFGPPGHAYVYFIYGMYYCVNVTCEPDGLAGAVLIRALEPVLGLPEMAENRGLAANDSGAKLTGGPGRLCQAMDITRPEHNGLDYLDADSPLQLREDDWVAGAVAVTPRIGIRHAADLPLRFSVADSAYVSKVPVTRGAGSRISTANSSGIKISNRRRSSKPAV
jgi:DNA-3-methyladenine glycosylase